MMSGTTIAGPGFRLTMAGDAQHMAQARRARGSGPVLVRGVILREDKVCLTYRSHGARAQEARLPGAALADGESFAESLARSVEDIGLTFVRVGPQVAVKMRLALTHLYVVEVTGQLGPDSWWEAPAALPDSTQLRPFVDDLSRVVALARRDPATLPAWGATPAGRLALWSIYDHPRDIPDAFVVRRFLVGDGNVTPCEHHVATSLEEARLLIPLGVVCIGRQDDDATNLVETWS